MSYFLITHDDSQISPKLLNQIADIESSVFNDPWDKQAILDSLASFGAGVGICLKDEIIIGYCICQVVFETAEVLRIATRPAYQGQGVAVSLLDELQHFAKDKGGERILLEVRADNTPAIALYQKVGFRQIDKRVGYYGGGIDALILQLILLN